MTEFEFIRKIKASFKNSWENAVGNDCAVFQLSKKNGLITKDLLVEGTHFYPEIPLQALAYKSLLVNMSDILSDGGTPIFFEIGIGGKKEDQKRIEELYFYYSNYCKEWRTPILGGDTVYSPVFFISVTCVGETNYTPWLRKNAQKGDFIYLTGDIGASSYGLNKIKEKGHDLSDLDISRHLFPPYLIKAVRQLKSKVHSAIDISDGFLQDLSRILEESGKGAELDYDRIPFSKNLPENRKDDFAFFGGEDYELIFCTSKNLKEEVFYAKTGIKISKIGVVTQNKNTIQINYPKKSIVLNIQDLKGHDHWNY